MGTFLSATAVTKVENGGYLIATDQEGIFVKNEGDWKKTLHLPNTRILDLKSTGQFVVGVGDAGLYISSRDGGRTWSKKRFHTNSSMWSVCCNEDGLVVTHSDKALYLSRDFGETWKIIDPFRFCKRPPSPRSLCLHHDELFIGTKIHRQNGGIWRLHLKTGEIRKVKKETNSMVASMKVNDGFLMAACGSCRGKEAKIVFCELSQLIKPDMPDWETCTSDNGVACYLDLTWDEDVLYTTSSKDKNGVGMISRIFLKEKKIVPFGEVKGHGWRIVNQEEEYVVAGLYESYHYKKVVQ